MMRLLQRGLEARGIPFERREPVASIDGTAPAFDPAVTGLLMGGCYEANPWQAVRSLPGKYWSSQPLVARAHWVFVRSPRRCRIGRFVR